VASDDSEPTEEPTPQRLLKARQSGKVAVSLDFSAALSFVALVAIIAASAPVGVRQLVGLFRSSLTAAAGGGASRFGGAAWAATEVLASMLAIPIGSTLAVAVLAGAMQTGGLFAWPAARPSWMRLSPATGLKKLVAPQTLLEMGKGLLKVTVVLAVAVVSIGREGVRALPRLTGLRLPSVLAALGELSERLAIRVALALVAWGTIDWLLARRRHRRSLLMTRAEVKREYKEAEGDPHHRSERQRLHRELGEQRMVADVRKADFVVVNPEHIAVAVKYDRDADAAPIVVAKGERLLAERIKQVARESGVPIYRDVGLARALNELPEGEEIPEALYEAVAELLRVLWEIEKQDLSAQRGSTGVDGAVPGDASSTGQAPPARSTGSGALVASGAPVIWKRV
jgi:flagellar biosynthesis protein FlhB